MEARALPQRDLEHVLEHTEGLWGELRGGRLFVTGGTGFFGRWMLESFLRANDELDLRAEVTVLTRAPEVFAEKAPHIAGHAATTLHPGDVRSFERPERPCTHVLHMATETALGSSGTASFVTAVRGTERVLEFANGSGARRVLFTSSGAVYGPQPPDCERIPEEYHGAPCPQDVASGYGHGKRVAEFLCAVAAAETGLTVTIARCFAFVGPLLPLDSNFAIGNFIRDALSRDRIEVRGDGTARRSYLYAADLALWLWTILFTGESRRPYNVGSEADLCISELASLVANVLRPTIPIEIAASPTPGQPPARYVPSTARALRELGVRDRVRLAEAICRTAQWHQGGDRRSR
jgi:dTDP-glucose 4,6-dehydratase